MEIKEMNLIVKITGIVGAVFCGISLIVPWAGWGPFFGAYTWGSSALGQWDMFYITTMSSGVVESIVFGICMIIAFVLTIIALILGIVGFKNVGIKKTNTFMKAGILSIVAVILCVVGISQWGGFVGYNAGFFLIIVALIMYFVAFGLQKAFALSPAQPMYQQNVYQPQPAQPMQPSPPPMPPPVGQPIPPPVQQTAVTPPPAQTSGKFCAECGAKIQPNVKFCPECGAKL